MHWQLTVPGPHREAPVLELTVGNAAFTVTTTASVAVQPLDVFVAVNVYVVVTLGFAIGFEIVADDKPVEGDQEYVTPDTATIPIDAPE
jgi:hypothetical protein